MAAFNSFLRRASASLILPLKSRSVGRVISAAVNVENRHFVSRQFLPFSQFSTITCDNLIEMVESKYRAEQSSNDMMIHIPDDFPFQVEENTEYYKIFGPYQRWIFRRKYKDEFIEVAVNGYEVQVIMIDDKPTISLCAVVSRGTQELIFNVTARPNQIQIHTFKILDHEFLRSFRNYLDIRGFNSRTIKFLYSLFRIEGRNIVGTIESSNVPDGFPFEIQFGEKELLLKRKFQDEIFEAHVDLIDERMGMRMRIKFIHGDVHFKFLFSVSGDYIYEMSMRHQSGHLEAFQDFLAIRGIKPSNTNFLFDYFKKKDELKNRISVDMYDIITVTS